MKQTHFVLTFFAVLITASLSSFAQATVQGETPTDEYGIPLHLQSPAKSTASKTATSSTHPRSMTAMPVAKQKTVLKKKESALPQVVDPEVLENQANEELVLPPQDLSKGVLPTPATVRSQVDDVKSPVRPRRHRLGISVQPFTPKGTMPITGVAPYNLSDVGTSAMVNIDGQWLPLKFEKVAGLRAGAFVSVGYAQFNLALRSPAGLSIDDSKLHVLKFQAGTTASYQLPKAPLWSAHGSLGYGRLLDIQTSTASYANATSTVDFASLGLAAERSLSDVSWLSWVSSRNVSVYAGYDLRLALNRTTEGADVPNHNVLLGFLGNFE